MRFILVDRVTEVVPGESLKAVKGLSLAEEYLADHFPRFPVMPGVLMIEALAQASAWLVRASEDFAHSMLLLAEARNVTYKSFAKPGQILELAVQVREISGDSSRFTGIGSVGQTEIVKANWTLRHFNLADQDPVMAALDRKLVETARQQWSLLWR